ncbi:hypothetical protein ACOMHN_053073 [Nucella lapillus]
MMDTPYFLERYWDTMEDIAEELEHDDVNNVDDGNDNLKLSNADLDHDNAARFQKKDHSEERSRNADQAFRVAAELPEMCVKSEKEVCCEERKDKTGDVQTMNKVHPEKSLSGGMNHKVGDYDSQAAQAQNLKLPRDTWHDDCGIQDTCQDGSIFDVDSPWEEDDESDSMTVKMDRSAKELREIIVADNLCQVAENGCLTQFRNQETESAFDPSSSTIRADQEGDSSVRGSRQESVKQNAKENRAKMGTVTEQNHRHTEHSSPRKQLVCAGTQTQNLKTETGTCTERTEAEVWRSGHDISFENDRHVTSRKTETASKLGVGKGESEGESEVVEDSAPWIQEKEERSGGGLVDTGKVKVGESDAKGQGQTEKSPKRQYQSSETDKRGASKTENEERLTEQGKQLMPCQPSIDADDLSSFCRKQDHRRSRNSLGAHGPLESTFWLCFE